MVTVRYQLIFILRYQEFSFHVVCSINKLVSHQKVKISIFLVWYTESNGIENWFLRSRMAKCSLVSRQTDNLLFSRNDSCLEALYPRFSQNTANKIKNRLHRKTRSNFSRPANKSRKHIIPYNRGYKSQFRFIKFLWIPNGIDFDISNDLMVLFA